MRCTIYKIPTASAQPATVWLIDEHGKPCPGEQCCHLHATSIIQEYQIKLGITWTTVPVDEYGAPMRT